ncbi:hypothetical protein [Scatolibacter rhodanostii]|uniref:hypothetical protein n=1 Tax=Scatolibacter rhodanostii TaxID=2014781 RepID=UPI000C0827B8
MTGRICTSTDSFGYYQCLPKMKKGDIIVIPNSGAYCYNMNPLQFLGYLLLSEALIPPNEMLINNKEKKRLSYEIQSFCRCHGFINLFQCGHITGCTGITVSVVQK